jgi:uncharacterized protein YidB (DUF937 family)
MGILDEVLQQLAQQQGKAAGPGAGAAQNAGGQNAGQSPLATIFQDLLTGCQQGADQSRQQQAEAPQSNAAARQAQQGGQDGAAALGGLGGLLTALQQAGLDDVVRSWVGNGQNKPVQPDQLGDALGKQTVTQMADKAGCNPNELLSQLAKALPGIIDKLTQDGRVPTQQEVNKRLAS